MVKEKKSKGATVQISAHKLQKFLYQDIAQSNNPITLDTLKDMKMAYLIGSTTREACHYAGITEEGYNYWRRHMPKELLDEWNFHVEKWKQDLILQARATIRDSIKNPQEAKWFLERKRKDEFSTRTEQEIKRVDKFSDISDKDLDEMIGTIKSGI